MASNLRKALTNPVKFEAIVKSSLDKHLANAVARESQRIAKDMFKR